MKVYTQVLQANGAELTCYIQQPGTRFIHRPAVLILPGGGYWHCSEQEAEPVALAYLHYGFQAFVLRYTTADKQDTAAMETVFSKAYNDAENALEYLRSHASELFVDANKIAAVGFSAGGYLAVALGVLSKNKPNALILGYTSVLPASDSKRTVLKRPELLEKVSVETPPSFLFSAWDDPIVPSKNTLLFALKLYEMGVPYELHSFLYGKHGFSLGIAAVSSEEKGDKDVTQWHRQGIRFLENIWDIELF